MTNSKQYLFLLGTHTELSVAELKTCATIESIDRNEALAIATDLQFSNPRDLFKSEEQLLLDQLGGIIRFGEIIGTFQDWDDLEKAFFNCIPDGKQTPKFRVGVTTFGPSKNPMRDELFSLIRKKREDVRISNPPQSNMTSARVFDERLIQKGVELLVWFRGDDYILAKTVATQNIRNYTVRDRQKGFRDAHMGMMPPKLVQIMMNLAENEQTELIIDPFCGSGTTNIEASLKGYKSIGSDLEKVRAEQSVSNFEEMAERFRYEKTDGTFFPADASDFPLDKIPNLPKEKVCVVTEGYLGDNFRRTPTPAQVQHNARAVTQLWQQVFHHWNKSHVDTFVFTLPSWKTNGRDYSISQKVLTFAAQYGWEVDPIISDRHQTYVYSRPDAFVGREICRVRREKRL